MTAPAGSPRSLPSWWEQWEGRLEWELDRFADWELPVTLIEDPRTDASRLVVETLVDLPQGPTPIVVVYPDGYPSRPFSVYAPELRLPRHQAPGGNLCVFPRDARYWHPDYSAAEEVAVQVPRLVALVNAGGEELRAGEDRQGEPFTTYYGASGQGGIVVDERALSHTFQPGDGGVMTAAFTSDNADWLLPPPLPEKELLPATGHGLLLTIQDRAGLELLTDPAPGLRAKFGNPVEGRWTFLGNPRTPKILNPCGMP